MTGEPTNLPTGGSDNAQPSDALDSPDNLNFWEPSDEEEPTAELEEAGIETDSEPDEPEDGQESDEPDTADEDDSGDDSDEGEEADAAEIKDDVTVTVNGEKLALSELKLGYMREKDYRHKTTEVSNKRRDLEALSNRVSASVEAVAEFLQSSLPPAPNPALAIGTQAQQSQYLREKTLHDTAMTQVAALIEKANAPKDVLNTLSAEQHKTLLETENAKLVEAIPTTATKEGRQKFFEGTARAAKELGFTDEELGRNTDHRLFKLAHYARIGLQAEAARAKANKKVENVPPVAPNKRQPSGNANKARRNQEAMKRLGRTGSIHDAMDIDFD